MDKYQKLAEQIWQLQAQIRLVQFASKYLNEKHTEGCTHGCTGACPDPTGDCTYNCTHGCTNGCTDGCGEPSAIEFEAFLNSFTEVGADDDLGAQSTQSSPSKRPQKGQIPE